MARLARLKFTGVDTWYHLTCRIAGHEGEYPLADPLRRRQLINTIRHYASIYFCRVAAFCIMGNHYHLVLQFEAEREVPRKKLEARAKVMYPGGLMRQRLATWSDADWERYRKRLFDVSEFMRNVQMAYARWYNMTYRRKGRFWGDRFHSVVLGDDRALLDCILYVELNPVRAGIVERPEAWDGASMHHREAAADKWLVPIEKLLPHNSREAAMVEFRQLLYHRGAVPTKAGQARISQELLKQEAARGYQSQGMFLRRLRFFTDGVVIGTEAFVRAQIGILRGKGWYRRRKNPVRQLDGNLHSLREQRSNAINL